MGSQRAGHSWTRMHILSGVTLDRWLHSLCAIFVQGGNCRQGHKHPMFLTGEEQGSGWAKSEEADTRWTKPPSSFHSVSGQSITQQSRLPRPMKIQRTALFATSRCCLSTTGRRGSSFPWRRLSTPNLHKLVGKLQRKHCLDPSGIFSPALRCKNK